MSETDTTEGASVEVLWHFVDKQFETSNGNITVLILVSAISESVNCKPFMGMLRDLSEFRYRDMTSSLLKQQLS